MPGYRLSAWLRPLLTLAALAGVLSLAACGGGNGAPNNPNGPIATPLTVTPASGIAYSGNPFTFLISGGSQPYTILSSDQTVLPVVGTLNGNALVVVPTSVGADTAVTLNVRDATGQSATASLTVRPQLLLPTSITVTGNTSCGASGATLCSGQNGTASVQVIGPAGAPLPGRAVRFDVVQGNFVLVSPVAGQPPVASLTATTDQNGFAVVTLQVPTSAITQIATIRATDLTSGNSISSNFTIVAFNDGSAVLSVSPDSVSVPGLPHDPPQCAIGVPVTYLVFGGTPPYTVVANLPTFVTIAGSPIPISGGSFTARATACVDPETFTITDASGRFITATLSSVLGPAATTGGGPTSGDCATFSPANPACPTVTPSPLALSTCVQVANATITAGTTAVGAPSFTSGLTATVSGTTLSVSRAAGPAPTTPQSVQVNAGSFFVTVPVTLSGAAAGVCP
jgi:hypothetical protein